MADAPWKDAHEFEFRYPNEEGPTSFSFLVRDGLVSKSEVRPAERALLAAVENPGPDVLVLEANYGAVGTVLARTVPGSRVTATESSARAVACCRHNADRNGATNVEVRLVPWAPESDDQYDSLLFALKPYSPTAVNRERLARGLSVTAAGGDCYLAVPDDSATGTVVETLRDACDGVRRVQTNEDCTVYHGTRCEAFTHSGAVPEHEFRATVDGFTCRFLTIPGLFSWEELDQGTELLVKHVSVPEGARVLDLACGYGAVGAFVGARTDCDLYATDDDILATTYAQRNYERNGVTPVSVSTADCLDAVADESFDVVTLNPPTHAGKGVTRKMFETTRDVLENGALYVVYNRIMNYDRVLQSAYGFDVEVLASVENFDVAVARQ